MNFLKNLFAKKQDVPTPKLEPKIEVLSSSQTQYRLLPIPDLIGVNIYLQFRDGDTWRFIPDSLVPPNQYKESSACPSELVMNSTVSLLFLCEPEMFSDELKKFAKKYPSIETYFEHRRNKLKIEYL